MFWITEHALIVCKHQLGKVQNAPTQDLVTIATRRVLVATDPEAALHLGLPELRPDHQALHDDAQGPARLFDMDPHRRQPLCLDTVTGYTDGTPPGVVEYVVSEAGQAWIEEDALMSISLRGRAWRFAFPGDAAPGHGGLGVSPTGAIETVGEAEAVRQAILMLSPRVRASV